MIICADGNWILTRLILQDFFGRWSPRVRSLQGMTWQLKRLWDSQSMATDESDACQNLGRDIGYQDLSSDLSSDLSGDLSSWYQQIYRIYDVYLPEILFDAWSLQVGWLFEAALALGLNFSGLLFWNSCTMSPWMVKVFWNWLAKVTKLAYLLSKELSPADCKKAGKVTSGLLLFDAVDVCHFVWVRLWSTGWQWYAWPDHTLCLRACQWKSSFPTGDGGKPSRWDVLARPYTWILAGKAWKSFMNKREDS